MRSLFCRGRFVRVTPSSLFTFRCAGRCNLPQLIEKASTEGPGCLENIPTVLSDYEGLDGPALTSFLTILSEHKKDVMLPYFSQARKWMSDRMNNDISPHVLLAAFQLADCVDAPSRAVFLDLWKLVKPFLKVIRLPVLCKAFYAIAQAGDPQDESIFKALAERMCIHWRQVTDPADVYYLVYCLNKTKFSHARILALLEVKIPALVPKMTSVHLVQMLLLPLLKGDVVAQIGTGIQLDQLPLAEAIDVMRHFIAKKIPIPNKAGVANMLLERINDCTSKDDILAILKVMEEFSAVMPMDIKIARRLAKSFLQIQACVDDLDLLLHVLKVTQCVAPVIVESGAATGLIFTALGTVISSFLVMDTTPDTAKSSLLHSFFEFGFSPNDNVRAHLSRLSERTDGALALVPSDVVDVLSGMNLCFGGDAAEVIGKMTQSLMKCIPGLTTSEVARVLTVLEGSNVSGNKELTVAIADRTAAVGKDFTPSQLSNSLRSLASLDCCTHRVFTTLRPQIDAFADSFKTSDLVNLIVIFSKVPATGNAESVLAKLSAKALVFVAECSPTDAVRVLTAVASRPLQNKKLMRPYTTRVITDAQNLRGKEVLSVLMCFSKLSFTDVGIYQDLLSNALRKRQDFTETDVGELVLTCAKVSLSSPEVFQQLALRAIAFGPTLSVKTCCSVLKGFVTVSARNEELFAVINNRMLEMKDNCSFPQMLTVLECFATMGVACTPLCHELLPNIQTQLHSASIKDCVIVLRAFAMSAVFTHKFVNFIAGRILFMERTMTANACVDALYSFAIIKQDHEKLIKYLFSVVPKVVQVLTTTNMVHLLKAYEFFTTHRDAAIIRELVGKLNVATTLSIEEIEQFHITCQRMGIETD